MRHLIVLALIMGVAGWAATLASAQTETSCAPKTGVTGTGGPAVKDGSATVSFTVADGCDVTLSLVSYTAPGPTFSQATADQQVLFKSVTQEFTAGSHSLNVDVPNCYFQVDFVYGSPLPTLGPAGTNNFYNAQGALIAALHGGTTTCGSTGGTGGTGGTQVTICHATGTPDNAGNGYVAVTADVEGVLNGHLAQHAADIIPPFTVNGVTYSQNFDATGQAIYNNGLCNGVVTTSNTNTNSNSNAENNNNAPTTPPAAVPLPSITLAKRQRVNGAGDFVSTPVVVKLGDTVDYELVVTDTGTTDVSVNVADTGCSALSLTGPQAIVAGASLTYTCSHVITAADGASYTNTAIATANNAGPVETSVQSTVVANVGTVSAAATTGTTSAGGVLGTTTTLKKHAVKKHHKVKKVTHKAKAARAKVAAARVTG